MTPENFEKIANTKFDLKVAKLNLLERVEQQSTFAYEGGLFKATPELMSYLLVYEKYNNIVILDEYQTPIEVNVANLMEKAREAHRYAMNAYLHEYNELKKVRKGDKL